MSADERLINIADKFVEVIEDILTRGEEAVTPTGEVVRTKPKPATLNVIRQFLKDNRVEFIDAPGGPLSRIKANLPSPEDIIEDLDPSSFSTSLN